MKFFLLALLATSIIYITDSVPNSSLITSSFSIYYHHRPPILLQIHPSSPWISLIPVHLLIQFAFTFVAHIFTNVPSQMSIKLMFHSHLKLQVTNLNI